MSEELKPQTEPLKKKVSEKKLRAEEAQGKEHTALTPTPPPTPPTEERVLAPIVRTSLPKDFHLSRSFANKYTLLEGELFPTIEGKKYNFSKDDFSALMFAVGQKLYNDSYSTGRAKDSNRGRALREQDAVIIDITLKEIIENGYGIETDGNRHRKEIVSLIDYLHVTPAAVLDEKGTGKFQYLLLKVGGKLEKYKTQSYQLRVHDILCDLSKGYGVFPQDIMKRLVAEAGHSITFADRRLLLHLGNQNREKPHTDKIESLVLMIGKGNEWKKNRKRVINYLRDTVERFKKIGVIDGYILHPKEFSITFYFKRPEEWSIEDKRSDSSKEGK